MEAQKLQIQEQINILTGQLTGDRMNDMEIKDQIHNLQMKLDGVRPMDSMIECEGCGS